MHSLTVMFQAVKQDAFQRLKQTADDVEDSRLEARHRSNQPTVTDGCRQAGRIRCNRTPDLPTSMQELRDYIKLLELEISH